VLESGQPLPPPALPATASTAVIVSENPQRIEIAVQAAADGYLVLLDTFYPGWTASIDGRPTPIYPANTIGRAVFTPAGQHTLLFQYQPLSFQVGLWLSAFAFAGLMIMAVRDEALGWTKPRAYDKLVLNK
jgi:uncharacterized membrane protein YfhO